MPKKDAALTINRLFEALIAEHTPTDLQGVAAAKARTERMAKGIAGLTVKQLQKRHADIEELQKSPTPARVKVAAVAARWGAAFNSVRGGISGYWFPATDVYPKLYEDMRRLLPAADVEAFIASIPRRSRSAAA